jgi:hypothetical protein
MTVYYYDNNLGNATSSDGLNDILLGAPITYHRSLATLLNQYVPYYYKHDTLNEWEYGLGEVVNNSGQDVLIRVLVYSSSNSNNKVSFGAGNKTVVGIINAERINHGGYNFTTKNTNFTADTVQTVYGVSATASSLTGQLPLASGNKNLLLGFKLKNDSVYSLVVRASGSETIDGSGSITVSSDTKYVELISDGSGWNELSREIQVDGAGLPSGVVGSVQFKSSSTQFGGGTDLFWDASSENLLIGGSTTGLANIVLPGSSGQKTVFNNLGYDTDLQVKGTGTNQLYFDASTGRLGINTNTPSTILHIIGKCAGDTLRLESTTQCPTGVALTLYHSPNTGSDVGDYPATINLAGRNSNGSQVNYAQIRSRILGTTIGSTSGEMVISVDNSGVSTNIITANVKRTIVGLGSNSNSTDNIILGNNVKDSGNANITLGHNTSISGAASNNNLVLSNSGIVLGSNNIAGGVSVYVSGNSISSLGANNNNRGNNIGTLGNNLLSSGSYIVNHGSSNNVSGNYSVVVGSDNTVSSTSSGIVYGYNNVVSNSSGAVLGNTVNVSGSTNYICGTSHSVSGNNNNLFGLGITINGSNNSVVGQTDTITGSNSIIIGDNNSYTGNGGIVIGRNINNAINSGVVIGVGLSDLVLSNTGLLVNSSGNAGLGFIVNGSGLTNGIYYLNNQLGVNKNPSSALDVNGTVRSSGIYTDTLRLGASSTSGSIIVSDTSGNGSWQPLSSLQQNLTNNLTSNVLVTYNGSTLTSASGLYWNSSGVYTSPNGVANPHVIIPTGNATMTVNASNAVITTILNVRGSGQPNLFNINGANNSVGINVGTPSYTLHVSGTTRVFNDALTFVERNNSQFIVAYDQGVSTLNRFELASSGLFIRQTAIGTVLPRLLYGSTLTNNGFLSDSVSSLTASEYNANTVKLLTWDSSDNQVKFSNDIYAGFGAFLGSTDS